MNEYIYFDLEYYQTKVFMQNFQNASYYNSDFINIDQIEFNNNMKFFTNLLRYTLETKFDLIKKNILLNEIEWNRIVCPTTFVTNYDVYNNLFVLITLNIDSEIIFEKNTKIFLKKNAIYCFYNITEPSFVLRPIFLDNLKSKLYYILYRSTNY